MKNRKKPQGIRPLFIWAGGKTKLINKYYKSMGIIPSGDALHKYIEPFFGAGAMYCFVKNQNMNAPCLIGDVNSDIMSIYANIKEDVESFIAELKHYENIFIPLSKVERKKYFYTLRNEHAYDYEAWSKCKESAVLYFLMKTGFNGIFQINKNTNGRFGTPSGLLNQKDEVFDYDNIRLWNKALQTTEIVSGSWDTTLDETESDAFVFCDPPYRGCFTSYGQRFTDEDQKKLLVRINLLSKNNIVMLCNRDIGDDFFEDNISKDLDMVKMPITYTAGRRKKQEDGTFLAKPAIEILIYSKTAIDPLLAAKNAPGTLEGLFV